MSKLQKDGATTWLRSGVRKTGLFDELWGRTMFSSGRFSVVDDDDGWEHPILSRIFVVRDRLTLTTANRWSVVCLIVNDRVWLNVFYQLEWLGFLNE